MNDGESRTARPADLWTQLEALFDVVCECERQWRVDDRLDLILGVRPRSTGR